MSAVSIQVESITPILIVDAIEPCLAFWESLGFQRIAEVPHGEHLGFLMFTNGKQNLMLQTEANADADILNVAPRRGGGVVYLNVSSIALIDQIADSARIVIPKRTTFYGAVEVWVREPGGNLVGFAEHTE